MPHHPSYGHICKRINGLKADINGGVMADDGDDHPITAIDSTGIKITNRPGDG
jgi:hypothetical protein